MPGNTVTPGLAAAGAGALSATNAIAIATAEWRNPHKTVSI
ncbi:hypothetical protein I546_6548 [Mycobacterium kansasii 732]|nr:hypothetical protein I546_6548 [Mycobacterium kansasii 732]